jgi:hypothetical protein
MGPILPFLRPYDLFDSATLVLLAEAFEKAMTSIRRDHEHPALVREIIATHILDLAATGERDVNVLCIQALTKWSAFRDASQD